MATAYRIVLLHRSLDAFAQKVEKAVTNAANFLSGSSRYLEFSTKLSDEHFPQVVAYLDSEEAREDSAVAEVVEFALARDISILPIIDAKQSNGIVGQLPESIAHITAAWWSGKGAGVATSLWKCLVLSRESASFLYRIVEAKPMDSRRSFILSWFNEDSMSFWTVFQ